MTPAQDEEAFKGVVKSGAVVFEESVSLPDGTPVVVTVRAAATGSPQAVLAALAQPPHLDDEDVVALLEEVDRGKRPVCFGSPSD